MELFDRESASDICQGSKYARKRLIIVAVLEHMKLGFAKKAVMTWSWSTQYSRVCFCIALTKISHFGTRTANKKEFPFLGPREVLRDADSHCQT